MERVPIAPPPAILAVPDVVGEMFTKGLPADVCGRRKSRALREAGPRNEVGGVEVERVKLATPGDRSPRGRMFT